MPFFLSLLLNNILDVLYPIHLWFYSRTTRRSMLLKMRTFSSWWQGKIIFLSQLYRKRREVRMAGRSSLIIELNICIFLIEIKHFFPLIYKPNLLLCLNSTYSFHCISFWYIFDLKQLQSHYTSLINDFKKQCKA